MRVCTRARNREKKNTVASDDGGGGRGGNPTISDRRFPEYFNYNAGVPRSGPCVAVAVAGTHDIHILTYAFYGWEGLAGGVAAV